MQIICILISLTSDAIEEHDLLQSIQVPFGDPRTQYFDSGLDGFPAYGLREGADIKSHYRYSLAIIMKLTFLKSWFKIKELLKYQQILLFQIIPAESTLPWLCTPGHSETGSPRYFIFVCSREPFGHSRPIWTQGIHHTTYQPLYSILCIYMTVILPLFFLHIYVYSWARRQVLMSHEIEVLLCSRTDPWPLLPVLPHTGTHIHTCTYM
jgi:hypothetical protein